jgi:hypothetical protein
MKTVFTERLDNNIVNFGYQFIRLFSTSVGRNENVENIYRLISSTSFNELKSNKALILNAITSVTNNKDNLNKQHTIGGKSNV